jgi:DNA-binding transcriptional MerR regulator
MASSGEVAKRFGVSDETVRQWASTFGAWLSDSATPEAPPDGGRKPPSHFTEADLDVLYTVAELRKEQKGYEEIKQALEGGERREAPRELIAPRDEEMLSPQQMAAGVGEQRGEIKVLRERIEELKQELAEERARTPQLLVDQQHARNLEKTVETLEGRLDALSKAHVEAIDRAARAEATLAAYERMRLHTGVEEPIRGLVAPPIDGTSALDGSQEGKIVPFPDVEVAREQPRRTGLGGLLDRFKGR